jgi:hypothetical protein
MPIAIDNMSGQELVEAYNVAATIIGANIVRKFSDRTTGLRRTKKMQDAARDPNQAVVSLKPMPASTTEPKPKATPKPKAKATSKAKKAKAEKAAPTRRGMRFVFPYHGDASLSSIQREDSLRGRAIAKLKGDGATYEDIVGVVKQFDADRGHGPGNVERRAYELIRLLHYYVGYGLRQDENGTIHLHTDEPKSK